MVAKRLAPCPYPPCTSGAQLPCLPLLSTCLSLTLLSAGRLLLQVEWPWSEVYKSVAAPMFRHRYGT